MNNGYRIVSIDNLECGKLYKLANTSGTAILSDWHILLTKVNTLVNNKEHIVFATILTKTRTYNTTYYSYDTILEASDNDE